MAIAQLNQRNVSQSISWRNPFSSNSPHNTTHPLHLQTKTPWTGKKLALSNNSTCAHPHPTATPIKNQTYHHLSPNHPRSTATSPQTPFRKPTPSAIHPTVLHPWSVPRRSNTISSAAKNRHHHSYPRAALEQMTAIAITLRPRLRDLRMTFHR